MDSHDTRDRMVRAAIDLFSANGFDGTSMREIADKVGVTKPALYHHFASKDALLKEAVGPLATAIDDLVATARSQSWTPTHILERYVDAVMDHKELAVWLSGDSSARSRPILSESAWRNQEQLVDLLRGDDHSFERGVRVACALGAVQVGILMFATTGGLERAHDEIVRSAVSLLEASR